MQSTSVREEDQLAFVHTTTSKRHLRQTQRLTHYLCPGVVQRQAQGLFETIPLQINRHRCP